MLRRSELIALQLADIERRAGGVRKLRPVEALDARLAAAKIISGPVFREVDRHGRVRRRSALQQIHRVEYIHLQRCDPIDPTAHQRQIPLGALGRNAISGWFAGPFTTAKGFRA